MLGIEARPTQVAGMIMPPTAHGVRVISIGMFVEGNTPVAWRGTMLHRALNQFLTDVYWGDLDVLLVDLPPGTGDIAISLAQFVPGAEVIVVTTPQLAAAEVAERAGTVALQTRQRVAGVIENMAWLPCPHCGDRVDVFGSGGGQKVVDALTRAFGTEIPLLGQIPLDPGLVSAGDAGVPFVLSHPQAPASIELARGAVSLAIRERGLVGRRLGLQPAGDRSDHPRTVAHERSAGEFVRLAPGLDAVGAQDEVDVVAASTAGIPICLRGITIREGWRDDVLADRLLNHGVDDHDVAGRPDSEPGDRVRVDVARGSGVDVDRDDDPLVDPRQRDRHEVRTRRTGVGHRPGSDPDVGTWRSKLRESVGLALFAAAGRC
jgi:hypothetical protein